MRGWVQVEPPEGASTDDEYYFAPSLFRAHNARERLAMLAGLPATEQRDSALVAQLQGASLSHGVSVGAPLPHGAPIPTAEFSSLGLSSLRAGAAPTGRAPADRTRTERRERCNESEERQEGAAGCGFGDGGLGHCRRRQRMATALERFFLTGR